MPRRYAGLGPSRACTGFFGSSTRLIMGVASHNSTRFRVRQSRGSTIGEGGDTTISSPGKSPKQPLLGIRLHDPLYGRQACPEFIAFDQGVGQICPR